MAFETKPWWQGVEVRHLAALSAIAREGSFRSAAEALGYVQSAVSQQLAQLEALVGEQLVVRRPGSAPVALTNAGELLLAHAEEIMARFDAAHAELSALGEPSADPLRVGVLESVETHLMPRILVPLIERLPDLQVETTTARGSRELFDQVEHGQLDLAFHAGPPPEGRLRSVRLLSDPYLLVVPVTSELATQTRELEPSDLSGVGLVGHDLMSDVESQLRRAGVTPRVTVGGRSNAAVQALAAAGAGAAILPALAVNEADPRVACLRLDGLVTPGALSLAWRRGRRLSPVQRQFIQLAERTGRAMEHELAEDGEPPRLQVAAGRGG